MWAIYFKQSHKFKDNTVVGVVDGTSFVTLFIKSVTLRMMISNLISRICSLSETKTGWISTVSENVSAKIFLILLSSMRDLQFVWNYGMICRIAEIEIIVYKGRDSSKLLNILAIVFRDRHSKHFRGVFRDIIIKCLFIFF